MQLISFSARKFSSQQSPIGKLVVFGGNGFVGQSAIISALKLGFNVTSINRSGESQELNIFDSRIRFYDLFRTHYH